MDKILVTGATGFIGRRLLDRLVKDGKYKIRVMVRDPKRISYKHIEIFKGDASNYEEVSNAVKGVDVIFYLIHSMEGSDNWKRFAERDRMYAENFVKAANEHNVKKIIYLGGLYPDIDAMSEHMKSRKEVGDILNKANAKVIIFRAAIIIGNEGSSYKMLKYLVERLPIMLCPKWVLSKCQPIHVDDVISYLIKAVEADIEGVFDIGADILTYKEMMETYGRLINKNIMIIILPFLTLRLSSYWIDLVTPVNASIARPLIDSLKHDAIVKDERIKNIIPIKLKSFEEAVIETLKEQKDERIDKRYKYVIALLAFLGFFGLTFFIDRSIEVYTSLLVPIIIWYIAILPSLYFLAKGTKLGLLLAGILCWISLIYYILDNISVIMPLLSSISNNNIIIRNFVGIIISSFAIVLTHNLFHSRDT